jgi:hypothetical protein
VLPCYRRTETESESGIDSRSCPRHRHCHIGQHKLPFTNHGDATAGIFDDDDERFDQSITFERCDIPSRQRQRRFAIVQPHLRQYGPGRPDSARHGHIVSPLVIFCTDTQVLSEAHSTEWVDGLSLLRPEGYVSTPETSDIIHALTDIQVKVKLLDLRSVFLSLFLVPYFVGAIDTSCSGERVEIPSQKAGECSFVLCTCAFALQRVDRWSPQCLLYPCLLNSSMRIFECIKLMSAQFR